MFEQIKEIIAAELGVEIEKITMASHIVDDLGADSLDVVELIMAFEDAFDVTVSDNQAQNMRTVKDVVDYIEGLK